MRKLIFSIGVSLDGYIAGPDGTFDWSAPDDDVHRVRGGEVRELDAHLLGRHLYETMVYWETADQNPEHGETDHDFAALWQALPKIVFSTTLTEVVGENTRLATRPVAEEVAALKAEPGRDIAVGGAGLAAGLTKLGLIDEYRLWVYPVVVGGGTPYFPPGEHIDLERVETRTFESGVVCLRYRRV
jgi:dihydrofolate reductase